MNVSFFQATFHLTLKLLPEMVHAYKMCVKPKVAPGAPPLGEIYPVSRRRFSNSKFFQEEADSQKSFDFWKNLGFGGKFENLKKDGNSNF